LVALSATIVPSGNRWLAISGNPGRPHGIETRL
jgi:hypothetical protein